MSRKNKQPPLTTEDYERMDREDRARQLREEEAYESTPGRMRERISELEATVAKLTRVVKKLAAEISS